MKMPNFSFLKGDGVVKAQTRGLLWALVITLVSVLVFALIVKYAGLSENVVKPIIQVIKAYSIFVGVYSALKTIHKQAWLQGGILGLIYTCLSFVILSIIDNNFSITSGFLFETLFSLVVGIGSAMLLRLRKKEN